MRKLLLVFFCFTTTIISSQPPRLVLPVGHTGLIRDSKFSLDDKLIITASSDKTVKVWDRLTGKELQTLSGHTDEIVSAAISKDGKYVTTASYDKTARVFDIKTGRQLRLVKHTDWVYSSQLSADSKLLLTASKDNSVCLWNVADGKKLFSFDKYKGEVKSAVFSPDEKYILSYDYDEVHVLKKNGQQLFSYYPRLKRYDKGSYYGISHAGYNPDGSMIIVIQKDDNSIRLVDAATGEEKMNIPAHDSFINSAYFNSSGSAIVTSDGTRVNVWDTKSGKNLFTINKISPYRLTVARFTSDNKYLVIASFDKVIFFYDPVSGKLLNKFDAPGQPGAFSYNASYMLIFPDDYSGIIWDIGNRKINQRLRGFAHRVSSARFNFAGDKIVVGGSDGPTRIIDINTCNNLLSIKTPSSTQSAVFSPDEKQLLSYSYDSTIRSWDARTGKEHLRLRVGQAWLSNAEFHSSGKMILAFEPEILNSGSQTARVWETASGRLLFSLKEETEADQFESAMFSPDGTSIITASSSKIKFWDIQKVKPTKVLNTGGMGAVLSPRGKYLAVKQLNDIVEIRDPNTGTLHATLKGHQHSISDIAFHPDNKWVATASYDSTARIWDPKRGALLHILKGHKNWINSIQFHPANNLVLTCSWDNTVRLWNANTGKLLSMILLIDTTDLISITPAGFYQCTPAAVKRFHYVTKDMKVITFEQLDVKYNRPDKVQESLGNTDTALIRSYRKAWEKRIKKLGIDTTQFRDGYSVPECDFVNRDNIEYEQKTGNLTLHIKGMDSSYKLDRFNVWVNESPVFGQRGISIRRKNNNSLDTTISIKLSQGENRIETSITNVNGTESYRMPLIVNYTPVVKQKETLRFIGIGIDKFADPKNNLQYSSKDIRDLSVKLKEKYKGDIIIDTLFNENVTISNVKALKQRLQETSVNDKVIISYSGHGLLSKEYDYFLSTYAINFDKPEENGLPYDELENLLDSIPARKKLMLIDACHSGEVDKEEIAHYKTAEDSLMKQGTKGGELRYTGKTQVGMKNSFELMQSLFVNVGKSTGATIISAAAGTQFALERGDLRNGVFTYCILEAMDKNPTMKISQLKKTVGERVEQLTNGLQKPTSRNETIASDWNLW